MMRQERKKRFVSNLSHTPYVPCHVTRRVHARHRSEVRRTPEDAPSAQPHRHHRVSDGGELIGFVRVPTAHLREGKHRVGNEYGDGRTRDEHRRGCARSRHLIECSLPYLFLRISRIPPKRSILCQYYVRLGSIGTTRIFFCVYPGYRQKFNISHINSVLKALAFPSYSEEKRPSLFNIFKSTQIPRNTAK